MNAELLEHYARDISRRDEPAPGSHRGTAGGSVCGDVVAIALRLEGGRVADARWEAAGCASARAAAAAATELLDGVTLPEAALISAASISAELGGLSQVGAHAAALASEALHRALGAAVSAPGPPESLLDRPELGERVLVAMSGGVDSGVAALRSAENGAEVIAVTLELWSDPANDGERSCCSADAVRTARELAHSLGIPHLTVDLRDAFRAGVVEPFLAGYAAGRTPNPCVSCNGRVRLAPMIDLAERLGAAALATGHYARLVADEDGPLLTAADSAKDQTFMLAGLPTERLARLRFPLGGLSKPEVRAIARERGLAVADRIESQDLCFLSGIGKRGFLERHGGLNQRDGAIVSRSGAELGRHRGHHEFTVGQRRGIGVASPEPLYVLATDAESNRVVVGTAAELATDSVTVRDAVLHRPAERVRTVKLRYRARALSCRVHAPSGEAPGAGSHPELRIELLEQARAAAPGQTAVFCDGDAVVGHATIA